MRNFRSLHTVLLLGLLAGCSTTPSTPTPEGLTLSGSFTIREHQVVRIAVGTSARGTLIFQGWQYPFTIENAKVDVAGDNPVEVHATVYNLEKVEDFEGVYTLEKAEIEKGGEGISGVWARNEKGVVAHLRTEGQDVEIKVEATGAKITLK